jgi:hypothetical protein
MDYLKVLVPAFFRGTQEERKLQSDKPASSRKKFQAGTSGIRTATSRRSIRFCCSLVKILLIRVEWDQ